ncbi:hypothetical protein ACQ86N_19545 [Puia sp. P3]|uniref:hypothetical protein n=1 Tax=Puia sp. P3 TaxID=3423952 RepID=UPI003D67A01D
MQRLLSRACQGDKPIGHEIICCLLRRLLLASASCEKHSQKSSSSQSLKGSWELRAAQSSMLPLTSYLPGNANILKFTDDTYSISSNGQTVKTGNYTVVEDHSFNALVVPAGQFIHRVDYQDAAHQKVFFQINGDTLTFLSGVFALDSGVKMQYRLVSQ